MVVDFDEDLRVVFRRVGCKNEKIVFILDEFNILELSFLEWMNIFLVNGEVLWFYGLLWYDFFCFCFWNSCFLF